jgi:hypothetical protein
VGRGLNADNVGRACSVLLAPCTCEVQGKLARFDLLLRADWGPPPAGPAGAELPDTGTPGEAAGRPREGERVPLPAPRPSSASPAPVPPAGADVEEASPLFSRWLLLPTAGLAALLVVLTGAWALRSGRRCSD